MRGSQFATLRLTDAPSIQILLRPRRLPLRQGKTRMVGVAQLVRALACHARGREFESRHSRHIKSICCLISNLYINL